MIAAERQGDHFGFVSFDDRLRSFIPAKSGKAHFGACRDAIYNLKTSLVSPDFNEVFSFIGSRLRRRALLVFLTSLDDPLLAESFSHAIEVISRRHLILVGMASTRFFPVLRSPRWTMFTPGSAGICSGAESERSRKSCITAGSGLR